MSYLHYSTSHFEIQETTFVITNKKVPTRLTSC